MAHTHKAYSYNPGKNVHDVNRPMEQNPIRWSETNENHCHYYTIVLHDMHHVLKNVKRKTLEYRPVFFRVKAGYFVRGRSNNTTQ